MTDVCEQIRIAAAFDVDGTLVAQPSLEWRFLAALWRSKQIPVKNYFLWLSRALRLALQGPDMIRHANKMYLRGVRVQEAARWAKPVRAGMAVPLLPSAVERVAWHAAQGHTIVLVSGTLAPLARRVAAALGMKLALRGIAGRIDLCATELEEIDGKWSGEIVGEAVVGDAKARTVRRFASERGLTLSQCYAYADQASDRWMLEAVGWPIVVNPSRALARIARQKGWLVLNWIENELSPQRAQRARRRTERVRGYSG